MLEFKIIKDWVTKSGLRACCIVNQRGTMTGYVEVHKDSKLAGMEYNVYSIDFDDIEEWLDPDTIKTQRAVNKIEVHGGLTYGNYGNVNSIMPSEHYWFGFDTCHSGDAYDLEMAWKYLSEPEDIKQVFLDNYSYLTRFSEDTYKDLD